MKNMAAGTTKIETSITAMVVSTLMESTSVEFPKSCRTIGLTSHLATSGSSRHMRSITQAWNSMDRYSSFLVTSFTVSRGICRHSSLESHFVQ